MKTIIRKKTDEPTDVPEYIENPWIIKRSRKPRKDVPAPIHTNAMDDLKPTAKNHRHAPRGRTTLRKTRNTRGSIIIPTVGNNIKRRKVTLTEDLAAIEKIEDKLSSCQVVLDNLVKGQLCSKKTITSKPQGHQDFGNTQTALSPKRIGQKIQLWHWPTKPTNKNVCLPAPIQANDAPESPNQRSTATLAESTKQEAHTKKKCQVLYGREQQSR